MRSHFPTAQVRALRSSRNPTGLIRDSKRLYAELEAEAAPSAAKSIRGRSQLSRTRLALAYLETADFETFEGARV